jgi:hypothetical protein
MSGLRRTTSLDYAERGDRGELIAPENLGLSQVQIAFGYGTKGPTLEAHTTVPVAHGSTYLVVSIDHIFWSRRRRVKGAL